MKSIVMSAVLGALLVGCNGNNDGNGSTPRDRGNYSGPELTVQQFITSIESRDFGQGYYSSHELLKDFPETIRYQETGEKWFVIYDDKYAEYIAVNLSQLRRVTYNNIGTWFRDRQSSFSFNDNARYYEVVTYDTDSDLYVGSVSGSLYEDQLESTDVNLQLADQEEVAFYEQAAAISVAYSMKIDKAMTLVSLKDKTAKMMKKGQLNLEDMAEISEDIEQWSGVKVADFFDQEKRQAAVEQASKNLGTSASTLEQKLIPELTGIEL